MNRDVFRRDLLLVSREAFLFRRHRADIAAEVTPRGWLVFRSRSTGNDPRAVHRFTLIVDALDQKFGPLDAAKQGKDCAAFTRCNLGSETKNLRTQLFNSRKFDMARRKGTLPRAMPDVLARNKDIMYSSRTRHNTDVYRKLQKWKMRTHEALARIPEDLLSENERKWRNELADLPEITILHLIYQQKAYEGHAKDYEFSGTSMREHWESGYEDTMRTLKQRHWLELPPQGGGIQVHDVHKLHEGLRTGGL